MWQLCVYRRVRLVTRIALVSMKRLRDRLRMRPSPLINENKNKKQKQKTLRQERLDIFGFRNDQHASMAHAYPAAQLRGSADGQVISLQN